MKGLIVKKYLVCALMLIAIVLMPVFASIVAPIWLKVLIIVALLALQSALIYFLSRITKNIIQLKQKEISYVKNRVAKKTLLDTYAILGINPQYKSDGTLKTVYELLKINPQYDKNGKRMLTSYELLGINPIFTEQAQEIPYIFRIKNRVKALVKATGSVPLYFIPRTRLVEKEKGAKVLPILPVGETAPKAPFASTKVVGKVNKANASKPKTKAETPTYGKPSSLKVSYNPLSVDGKTKFTSGGGPEAAASKKDESAKPSAPAATASSAAAPAATVTLDKPTAPATVEEKKEEHKSVDNAVNNDELNNIKIGTPERASAIENIVIKSEEVEISAINNIVIKTEETHEARTEVRNIVIKGAEKDLSNNDIKNKSLNVDGMSRE